MTTFGCILLGLAGLSFLVSAFRRAQWLLVMGGGVCAFGILLSTAQWYAAHYMPTPHGAGVLLNFSDELETELQLYFLLSSLVWSLPLIGYGAGAWVRNKINSWRTPRVARSF
jgi:hypothetical protein